MPVISIKSDEGSAQKRKRGYPILMQCIEIDFIVLFSGPSSGTVVYSESDEYAIGDYHTTWSEKHFQPYEGQPISLRNSW